MDYSKDLGNPGQFPFTRGIYETMYRGRPWTMRQYAGFGDARETNARFKYLLEHGQTGLSVAFDLPTQMGYDSDHPMAKGEVGRVGVAIDSIDDMEMLMDGIPLGKVSTSMTINSTASILLAFYLAVADKQKVPWGELRGTVQNDILKEYIARGTYIYPPNPSLRIITDLITFCQKNVPKWNAISISGYHMREAGCTAVQEVAFTLMNGFTYLDALMKRGVSVDVIAPQISFFFGVHNDFIEEIAKFRAARRLWARLLKERFKAKEEKSGMLRFHAQTAGCTLTAQQPRNNIVRVTLQALSAVLGGCQSLHTNSYDEALALPTEESARIALRTQQMIASESGVVNTADPCGGSYVIEEKTNEIESAAKKLIDRIDEVGGMLRAVESGFVQREIQEAAFQYQRQIEEKQRIVVGVNEFQLKEGGGARRALPLHKIDSKIEQEKCLHLKKLCQSRDETKVDKALKHLGEVAKGSENLMPVIIEAVEEKATLGEISDALRKVFGEYKENVVV